MLIELNELVPDDIGDDLISLGWKAFSNQALQAFALELDRFGIDIILYNNGSDTYHMKLVKRMTDLEISSSEEKIFKELQDRWGQQHIYKVQVSSVGKIDIDCSEILFLAWDDDQHWDNIIWRTANSNLESIFAITSEFKNSDVVSYGYRCDSLRKLNDVKE